MRIWSTRKHFQKWSLCRQRKESPLWMIHGISPILIIMKIMLCAAGSDRTRWYEIQNNSETSGYDREEFYRIKIIAECCQGHAGKIDFFKSNSGMNQIDCNAISGQLTILNGEHQILCQRDNPNLNLFKEFGVNEEDVQYIRVLLHQTSVQIKKYLPR